MRIVPGDARLVHDGARLFDSTPSEETTEAFLAREGHHLLFAVDEERRPLGFVSGVETTHPDKGTEMFLYELAVLEEHRNQGIGRALVGALADVARERGCYGMWVGTEPGNAAALAAYRAAGASEPDPFLTLEWRFDRRSLS